MKLWSQYHQGLYTYTRSLHINTSIDLTGRRVILLLALGD